RRRRPGGSAPQSARRPRHRVPRLAGRPRGRRPLRALPRRALPRGRGFWDCAARSRRRGASDDRARPRRRARDDGRPRERTCLGLRVTDVPPFRDYALQLVPVLIVWGFAFHAFDLYRPSRLGSHLSEWFDVAKASTLGVLVLVAIMTFAFRGYDYSRLVIAFFLVQSVVVVSLARAAFREVLRFARRRGYNQRYAIVVGG